MKMQIHFIALLTLTLSSPVKAAEAKAPGYWDCGEFNDDVQGHGSFKLTLSGEKATLYFYKEKVEIIAKKSGKETEKYTEYATFTDAQGKTATLDNSPYAPMFQNEVLGIPVNLDKSTVDIVRWTNGASGALNPATCTYKAK